MPNTDGSQNSFRCLLVAWSTSAIIIPYLSAFGRPLQHWVFSNIGEGVVAVLISLILIGMGAAAIYWQANRGTKGRRYNLVLIVMAMVVTILTITIGLPRTEERLHFATFGLFGFFSRRLFPVWAAFFAIVVWSASDELFQAWLPDRVGDWRDVGINILAGFIGLGFAWAGSLKESRRAV